MAVTTSLPRAVADLSRVVGLASLGWAVSQGQWVNAALFSLVLLGLVIGIPLSLVVTRVLSSLLIGLTTTDALTIGVVTVLLVGVTLLACYLPARRATRVDPLETLRYE